MKYGLLIALLLSACGSGGTYSEAPTANDIRCAELLQRCEFNDSPGCLAALKTNPTPEVLEQIRLDQEFFAEFCES